MEYFAAPLMVGFILAFVGFAMWLRQQRRQMIHRERLAALDKGVELPIEREEHRISWNVQRILLLFGLVWISVGISFYMVFSAVLAHPNPLSSEGVPYGIQYVGVGMVGIGLSHLIAYAVGRNREV